MHLESWSRETKIALNLFHGESSAVYSNKSDFTVNINLRLGGMSSNDEIGNTNFVVRLRGRNVSITISI